MALPLLLLLLSASLLHLNEATEEDNWSRRTCSKDDEFCIDGEKEPPMAVIFDFSQSVSAPGEATNEGRVLTPTGRMMKTVYMEAKMNFPLMLHFDMVLAMKKRGVDLGNHLHEPSDAGEMAFSMAQTLHIGEMTVLAVLAQKRSLPISLAIDIYKDGTGRYHYLYLFQYVERNKIRTWFWRNRIFQDAPTALGIYHAFTSGLLEDEYNLRDRMGMEEPQLLELFQKNLVAVGFGGASNLSEIERARLLDGPQSLFHWFNVFRAHPNIRLSKTLPKKASPSPIVEVRCERAPKGESGAECALSMELEGFFAAFKNSTILKQVTISEEDEQRMVNASKALGLSENDAVAAGESYRKIVQFLHEKKMIQEATELGTHDFWQQVLSVGKYLGMNKQLRWVVRRFLAIPLKSNPIVLAHTLLRDIDKEQVLPLHPQVVNALLEVQMNGLPLSHVDVRPFVSIWLKEGHGASDDKRKEISEKMEMVLENEENLQDVYEDYDFLYDEEDLSFDEVHAIIAKKRKEIDAEEFLRYVRYTHRD